MKKLLSLLLALLMVVSVFAFVACSDDTTDAPKDDANDTPSTPSTDPVEDEEEDDARIPLELPEKYYGNETFHIVEWTVSGTVEAGSGWLPWHEGDATDEEGDLMSNAVFARNAFVEEKYGVEITQEYADVNNNEHVIRVQQDNQTGENGVQLVTTRALQAWNFIETGLLHDMYEIGDGIFHFDQPWWVQDAVVSYTLGDGLYVCSTEMLLRDKGATAALYFNPKLAEDYGLGNLYEYVEAGEWTVENMIACCEIVAGDRDGDDLINSAKDMWGVTDGDDTIYHLFAAMDLKFGIINDEGYLEYQFGSEETITTMQYIFEEVMYADWYYNSYANPLEGMDEGGFEADLSLFSSSLVKSAYTNLREMETDYGVLPMPMADSSQDNYNSLVWVHHDSVLGIPSAVADPEMCAIILEELSYGGYYTVTPVLLDTLIYGRLAKTEEAKASFQTIFNTRVYDPGQYWNPKGLVDGTDSVLRHTATGNSNIMSLWETHRSATEEQVKLINEFIDETK